MKPVCQPFVYILEFTDPESGRTRWYIGSRYSRTCQPESLWTTYFSSSTSVHKMILEHGAGAFKPRIKRLFMNKDEALAYEERFIRRCVGMGLRLKKALINGNIPNKGIPLTIGVEPTNKGKKYEDYLSPERAEAIREELRRPKTLESKEKMVATRRANGSYDGGSTHPRARKFLLTSPSDEVYMLHGNLKAKCKEFDLSWQALWHKIDQGPVELDRARYRNLTCLGPRFYNTIGWSITTV